VGIATLVCNDYYSSCKLTLQNTTWSKIFFFTITGVKNPQVPRESGTFRLRSVTIIPW